jgi:ribosomal protein S12 methylthiotransferase
MRRTGDGESFLTLLGRIRAVLPDVVLRTTVIAGFPGETRQDVSALHAFLRDARFDYVGVFPYSPEDGTSAAVLPNQITKRTRVARAQRLRDIADEIGLEQVAGLVGRTVDVLVEGVEEDGVIVGRWRGQAPEVDGVVLLDRGERGQIVSARIVDSLGYDLEGEVV